MSVATISVKILKGYTTPVAGRALSVADVTINSPSNAYTYPAGGFPLNAGANLGLGGGGFGLRGFDSGVNVMISQGGNYYGFLQNKTGGNPQTLYLRLIVLATGLEVAGGAALTADTIRVAVLGG